MREAVYDGPVLLAAPVALLAGIVSFFSPCILPLVPSYFVYATGLSGAEVTDGAAGRRRLVSGAALFTVGFGAVFVSLGVAAGAAASVTLTHRDDLVRVAGAVSVVLGLVQLGALRLRILRLHVPAVRVRWLPRAGLATAPVLGALLAAVWVPCVGPILGSILTLAYQSGTVARGGALLSLYTVGLSLPFLMAALVWDRAMTTFKVLREYARLIRVAAGGVMVSLGVAMLTGWWDVATQWLQLRAVA